MALALIIFGIMNVYSVDPPKGMRQLLFLGLSVVLILVLIAVSASNKNAFEIYSPFVYLFSLGLLVAVLIFGREINGAKAWFNFGFVSFQPVEVAKIGVALFLGNYICSPATEIQSRRTVITAFLILLIPIALIMLQPDLGSVLVFSAFIVALYREGFSAWYIFIPIIGGTLFLLSIRYPSFYVILTMAYLTLLISLLAGSFTYKREKLRSILGVQLGLIIFFGLLIVLQFFFSGMGNIDPTSGNYEDDSIVKFNTYLYGGVGIIIALISAFSISYFFIKDNAESPKQLFSSKFAPSVSYETGIITFVIFCLLAGVSFSSEKVYEKLPIHQQERIMVLFEGEAKYRDTSGYNLLYSKTAIGSGDFWGKGYLEGTIKIGQFVPEQSTDYIFCTVGEEWGFIGSSLLILIYGLFIIRLYWLAESQRSSFSRFFGYSIATIFLIHFFINIAMVMGLFPTVGIPLPFFSYGGSSLWSFITMLTIFLILNYRDRQSLI